ncbi:hypothetical protein I551_2822 [Mycobacterium ulcerans str. Harvey]|uniref:Uncharacterized protein n=1 Tax=Mycobacterium ulcerans str. Harvey TaxID=1299332 RepID=A0ABP3AID7_MYCUL|nr:hypothetical protein I551_2822 [Mycobacterium ulcerans str. Harvey]
MGARAALLFGKPRRCWSHSAGHPYQICWAVEMDRCSSVGECGATPAS